MKPRVLFAGLFHETNTFIDSPTRWEDFAVATGTDIMAKSGDDSPAAGFLGEAADCGWEVVPAIDARALPGGLVEDLAFENFWAEFARRAGPGLGTGVDAIFLVLHGAMVTASCPDVEGELLARIRGLAPELPVFGVLDLHANVTARMCQLAHGLVAYRKNPHTDAKAAAARAVRIMDRCHRQRLNPRMRWVRVPLLWPPSGTGTDSDPMRALTQLAAEVEEKNPEVLAVNVTPGFAFADTAESGLTLSAVVADGNPQRARVHLERMAQRAWEWRAQGVTVFESSDAVLDRIGAEPAGPVLLVEPSDNVGAGAPGDCTGLLRGMIAHRVRRGLVALNDPLTVAQLERVAPRQRARVAIGGHGWRLDAGPVEIEVTLRSLADGLFQLEDPQSHLASMSGTRFDMGRCAVVTYEGITILLTSKRTPPFDLGQFRSQGIEPRDFAVIGVKAAVAHRRAYDPIAVASWFVDTPGPCSDQLSRLPYRRLRRPVYPLDPVERPHFEFA